MGKIIKNGKEYKFGTSVGFQTGGDTIEILTQAEYDELVAAGATDDDIYYFIEDEKNGGVLVGASNVSYDNSESGLTATDVQGAVDEVNGKVDEISTDVAELNQKIQKVDVYVGTDKKLHFVDSEGADSVLPFSNGKYAKFTKFGSGNVGNGNGSTSSYTFTIPEDCDLIVFYITNTNAQNGASVANTGVFSFSGLSGDSKPTALSGTREYLVAIYNAKKGNTFSLHHIGQSYGATGSYRYAYGNDPN